MVSHMIKIWMDGKYYQGPKKNYLTELWLDTINPENSQDYKFLDFNHFDQHILYDIENSTSTLNIYYIITFNRSMLMLIIQWIPAI